jgi:hypothetical protein
MISYFNPIVSCVGCIAELSDEEEWLLLVPRGDIFRVQTRRVPLTIVFRYREIGGIRVQHVDKTFCSCNSDR